MYPLKFNPILKSMIWGGDKLRQYKAIDTDQMNIGESWELSGVSGNEFIVSNGEFAGWTITELIKEYGPELLGRKVYETYGERFPLLIKFIDARDDLSIQVHPDDAMAQAVHGQPFGKTEMWYAVSADKDAHLMSGLSAEITPEDSALTAIHANSTRNSPRMPLTIPYRDRDNTEWHCLCYEHRGEEEPPRCGYDSFATTFCP